jgi:hypothetical protein
MIPCARFVWPELSNNRSPKIQPVRTFRRQCFKAQWKKVDRAFRMKNGAFMNKWNDTTYARTTQRGLTLFPGSKHVKVSNGTAGPCLGLHCYRQKCRLQHRWLHNQSYWRLLVPPSSGRRGDK